VKKLVTRPDAADKVANPRDEFDTRLETHTQAKGAIWGHTDLTPRYK